MDSRLDRITSATDQIQADVATVKTDVREWRDQARAEFGLLLGATIVTALGLAALMAKGFGWF